MAGLSHSEQNQTSGGMAPDRLQSYADGQLRSRKTPPEIVDELIEFGLDRKTAADMVTNSLDDQWIEEGGGGPVFGQVGPKHMIAGILLMAGGAAGTLASYYSVFAFSVDMAYVFYGAIVAGAIDFVYGLIRFLYG